MTTELTSTIADFQRCVEARDRAAAERILDEEFVLELVQPGLVRMPRERWLAVLSEYVIHSYEVHEQTVAVDGDCAVALHRVLMRATVLGDDRSGLFVISDTWRLRDGSWRLWRRHSTPLAAGNMPR